MVTIKDVARVAGVSASTVSRVVRGDEGVGPKCRARVQEIINEMGYRPNINARALVSQKANMIGLVAPNFSSAFFGKLSKAVEESARKAKYKTMMVSAEPNQGSVAEREAIASLKESGCQNIILHSKASKDEELIQLAEEIPGLVLINRFVPQLSNRCVWIDNVMGGKLATELLLKKGHKKIAIVSNHFVKSDPVDRIEGVKRALGEFGLELPIENIVNDISHGGDIGGRQAVDSLLERGADFTAIVAFNDTMAIGAVDQLIRKGVQVPEQVSVIGFDNLPICTLRYPFLSTIYYPLTEMATYATQLSLQLTNKNEPEPQQTHMFIPELIERESVAVPPDLS